MELFVKQKVQITEMQNQDITKYIKSNDIEKAINFAQECTTKVVQKLGVSTI